MLKFFSACITKHFCTIFFIRHTITEKKESVDIVDTIYNEFYEQWWSQTSFCMAGNFFGPPSLFSFKIYQEIHWKILIWVCNDNSIAEGFLPLHWKNLDNSGLDWSHIYGLKEEHLLVDSDQSSVRGCDNYFYMIFSHWRFQFSYHFI